jgi:hypothetical protein
MIFLTGLLPVFMEEEKCAANLNGNMISKKFSETTMNIKLLIMTD